MLFLTEDSSAVNNERLAIVLGFLTLLSGLFAFLSCRTCIGWLKRLGIKDPTQNRIYAAFYKGHLYYWWSFGVLVVAHLMVAVLHSGLPQAGDPDGAVHWWVLGLGLLSALSALVIFFSCRIMPGLVKMASQSDPLGHQRYKLFFKGHSAYWAALGMLAAAHFGLVFSHAGVWPGG